MMDRLSGHSGTKSLFIAYVVHVYILSYELAHSSQIHKVRLYKLHHPLQLTKVYKGHKVWLYL